MRPRAAAAVVLALAASTAAGRAASPTSHGTFRCSGERWAVRNLLDAEATQVNYAPAARPVGRLRSLRLSRRVTPTTPRLRPHEFRTYALKTRLVAARTFASGDTVLVVGAGGRMLRVAFPDTHACVDVVEGPKGQDVHAASDEFENYCGVAPTNRWQRLSGNAVVSGVAFFSVRHAKPTLGGAPNGIELHPALSFSAPSCARLRGRWP